MIHLVLIHLLILRILQELSNPILHGLIQYKTNNYINLNNSVLADQLEIILKAETWLLQKGLSEDQR